MLEEVFGVVRTLGPSMSPFNAWVFLKGLETLRLRMKAHCEVLKSLLNGCLLMKKVRKSITQAFQLTKDMNLQQKQQNGFGGIVSFVVKGEREGAWKVIDNTKFISITGNLGDVKSTITHPATTTHGKLSVEAKQAAGIQEG